MFSKARKERYAKSMRLSVEELDLWAKSMSKILNKDGTTPNNIINCLYVYENIIKNRKPDFIEYNYTGLKNIIVKKYGKEIIELRKEGLGGDLISQTIELNHKKKLSKSTINKFLNQNRRLWENG